MRDKQKNQLQLHAKCCAVIAEARRGRGALCLWMVEIIIFLPSFCWPSFLFIFFSLRNPPHNSSFLYFHLWHLLQTLYCNCKLHETETMWPWSVSLCFVLVCSALIQSFHAESETNLSFKVEPVQLHVHVEVGLTGMVRCLHPSGNTTGLKLINSDA